VQLNEINLILNKCWWLLSNFFAFQIQKPYYYFIFSFIFLKVHTCIAPYQWSVEIFVTVIWVLWQWLEGWVYWVYLLCRNNMMFPNSKDQTIFNQITWKNLPLKSIHMGVCCIHWIIFSFILFYVIVMNDKSKQLVNFNFQMKVSNQMNFLSKPNNVFFCSLLFCFWIHTR
jgi:hypothetical protein